MFTKTDLIQALVFTKNKKYFLLKIHYSLINVYSLRQSLIRELHALYEGINGCRIKKLS